MWALTATEWPEWRKERQRQLACWYESVSMSNRKSASENIRVLEYHFQSFQRASIRREEAARAKLGQVL